MATDNSDEAAKRQALQVERLARDLVRHEDREMGTRRRTQPPARTPRRAARGRR